jgi:hypothetical protein
MYARLQAMAELAACACLTAAAQAMAELAACACLTAAAQAMAELAACACLTAAAQAMAELHHAHSSRQQLRRQIACKGMPSPSTGGRNHGSGPFFRAACPPLIELHPEMKPALI